MTFPEYFIPLALYGPSFFPLKWKGNHYPIHGQMLNVLYTVTQNHLETPANYYTSTSSWRKSEPSGIPRVAC